MQSEQFTTVIQIVPGEFLSEIEIFIQKPASKIRSCNFCDTESPSTNLGRQ